MLTAQISNGVGLINPTDYWSTARSGGRDGLGIISVNPEINRTLRGPGILPNDFDLSRHRSYLPLHHGWIVGQDRTYWNGYLGQTEEIDQQEAMRIVRDAARARKVEMWMSVVGGVASVAIAIALIASVRRGS
jgi:hypothetical protein